MVLTYFASGEVFGSKVPEDHDTARAISDILLLIIAWGVCLPVSIVSFILFVALKAIGNFF